MTAKKPVASIENVLAESQRARFVHDEIGPHFADLRSNAVARLQAAQRAGTLTEDIARAIAVEINALEDLKHALVRKVARAHGHPAA